MFTGLDLFYHKYKQCGLPTGTAAGSFCFTPLVQDAIKSGVPPSPDTVLKYIIGLYRRQMPPIKLPHEYCIPTFVLNSLDGHSTELFTRFIGLQRNNSRWECNLNKLQEMSDKFYPPSDGKCIESKAGTGGAGGSGEAAKSVPASSPPPPPPSNESKSQPTPHAQQIQAKWLAADPKRKCPFLQLALNKQHTALPPGHPKVSDYELMAVDGVIPTPTEPVVPSDHLQWTTAKEIESYLEQHIDRSVPGVNLWILNARQTWSPDRAVHSAYSLAFRRAVRCLLLIWSRRGGVPNVRTSSGGSAGGRAGGSGGGSGGRTDSMTKSDSASTADSKQPVPLHVPPSIAVSSGSTVPGTGTGTGAATNLSMIQRHPLSRIPKDIIHRIISMLADPNWL